MKRLADRRQRRVRRIGFWALVIAIGAYLLFVGDQRPHHLLLLWLEEQRTEEKIASLESERDSLRSEAGHLASDTLALEALAREKGMIRPGDLVYRIVPVPPDVRQAAAESLAARAARLAADSLAAAREAEATRSRSPTRRPAPDPALEPSSDEGPDAVLPADRLDPAVPDGLGTAVENPPFAAPRVEDARAGAGSATPGANAPGADDPAPRAARSSSGVPPPEEPPR